MSTEPTDDLSLEELDAFLGEAGPVIEELLEVQRWEHIIRKARVRIDQQTLDDANVRGLMRRQWYQRVTGLDTWSPRDLGEQAKRIQQLEILHRAIRPTPEKSGLN